MTPFILLALGLVLILIEFYVPGAIMGIAGGILIAVSIYMFASQAQYSWEVVIYVVAVAISIGYLIKFAIWRIKTAKPERSIYSNKDQEGFVASRYDQTAIGKRGTVLSDLKPGGYILIDGKQHQAISLTGYIPKSSEVLVIDGQEESLIVKLVKKEEI
jgi:membrane-bound ClpP family serine protease